MLLRSSSHHAALASECDRLLRFAEASFHPAGGFARLDSRGNPLLDLPIETWITARMTHVFALAELLGFSRYSRLIDHGLTALNEKLRDRTSEGWFTSVDTAGPTNSDKRAYEHAFIILATSSAAAAGHSGAEDLLNEALAVVQEYFWREDDGLVVDSWNRTWKMLEPYRGLNSNMHMVEAFLASSDLTGESRWTDYASRMVNRVVGGWARDCRGLLPEHFDEQWKPDFNYNRGNPAHPFRPYGVTIGHLFEWGRLAVQLSAALPANASAALIEDATNLVEAGVRLGWRADGNDGFVYTVDWHGAPAIRARLHWVLAEALAATATLYRATESVRFADIYDTCWAHAESSFIDNCSGSWHHELDANNRPGSTIWSGKPDVYHQIQAVLIPRLPLSPALASAIRHSTLR